MNSKKWSESDRNNVRFLPVTATFSSLVCLKFGIVTSRNVNSLSFTSCVNLIVEWIWLIASMYCLNSSVVPASMNLFQVWIYLLALLINRKICARNDLFQHN